MQDDRELFERAVAELDGLSRGALRRAKAERAGSPRPQRLARFDRRLARGEVEPEAILDLHGLDRHRAVRALQAFLTRQRRQRPTEVLVVHGKGGRILAEVVCQALDRHPAVAQHLPAPPRLGGDGARVVRLKGARSRAQRP